KPPPGVEPVHGAALPPRAARRLAVRLGHHGVRGDAARQGLSMLAVRGDHVAGGSQRGERADSHGFLPDVEMAEPADFAEGVRLCGFFFEPADQEHLTQHAPLQLRLGGGARLRGPGGGGGHYAVASSTWPYAWSLARTSGPA